MKGTLHFDHYRVLGVPRSASGDTIKRAFRRRAMDWHPDRNPSPAASRAFQAVKEAHDVLIDPARRADYDRRLVFYRPRRPGEKSRSPKPPPRFWNTIRRDRPPTPWQRSAFVGLHVVGVLFSLALVGSVLVGQLFDDWPMWTLALALPALDVLPHSWDGITDALEGRNDKRVD